MRTVVLLLLAASVVYAESVSEFTKIVLPYNAYTVMYRGKHGSRVNVDVRPVTSGGLLSYVIYNVGICKCDKAAEFVLHEVDGRLAVSEATASYSAVIDISDDECIVLVGKNKYSALEYLATATAIRTDIWIIVPLLAAACILAVFIVGSVIICIIRRRSRPAEQNVDDYDRLP